MVLAYDNVFSSEICADYAPYLKNQMIWPWNSIGRIKVREMNHLFQEELFLS